MKDMPISRTAGRFFTIWVTSEVPLIYLIFFNALEVRHDWRDLAAAAVEYIEELYKKIMTQITMMVWSPT